MNIKNVLLLVISTTLSVGSFAQFKNPSPSSAEEFKKRKTLYVEDFFDDEQQKEWLKKYWMFEHEIKFVSTDEIKSMAKKKEEGSLIMTGGVRAEAVITNDQTNEKEAYVMAIYLSESAKTCNAYQIDSRKKKEIVKLSLGGKPQSEAGMLYACQHFYNLIARASGKEKGADRTKIPSTFTLKLKEKTLYVPDYMTKASVNELKSASGLTVKIVDFETLSKAILAKDPTVAYCNLIFSDKQFNMGLFVINAEDGRPMVDAGVGGLSIGIHGGADFQKIVMHPIGEFSIKGSHAKAIKFYVEKAAKKAAKGK